MMLSSLSDKHLENKGSIKVVRRAALYRSFLEEREIVLDVLRALARLQFVKERKTETPNATCREGEASLGPSALTHHLHTHTHTYMYQLCSRLTVNTKSLLISKLQILTIQHYYYQHTQTNNMMHYKTGKLNMQSNFHSRVVRQHH